MAKKSITKTKMLTKTKNKVGVKTSAVVITVVSLIGLSLIIATLMPNSGIGNFFAASGDVDLSNLSVVSVPYCTYNPIDASSWSSIGNPSGKYVFDSLSSSTMTLADCQQQINWRAYCGGLPLSTQSGSELDVPPCHYTTADDWNAGRIIFSPEINEVVGPASREITISRLNDGVSEPNHQAIIEHNEQAIALDCPVCPLISLDDAVQTPVSTITVGASKINIYNGDGITGQKDLILKWGILVNRLTKIVQSSAFVRYCEPALPPGCSVSRSFDAKPILTEADKTNPHKLGLAIDITCFENATPANADYCSGKTSTVLNKILQNNPGFNIIRECNAQERSATFPCPGDNGPYQVIHIDLKNRNNPPGTPCLWTNCKWETTDCHPATVK